MRIAERGLLFLTVVCLLASILPGAVLAGQRSFAGDRPATDAPQAIDEVQNLRFLDREPSMMVWDPVADAGSYAIYRGPIDPDKEFTYNHKCVGMELQSMEFMDVDDPWPGEAFYYIALASTYDDVTGEISTGPLGAASDGMQRPDSRYLPCGYQIYVDPDAAGAGTGSSWADAYTTIAAALKHREDERKALEIWVTGTIQESITIYFQRRFLHFIGGFLGEEQNQWDRSLVMKTPWEAEPESWLFQHWDLIRGTVSVDGFAFHGDGGGFNLNCLENGDCWSEFRRCDFGCMGDWAIFPDSSSDSDYHLHVLVQDSQFSCSQPGPSAVFAHPEGFNLDEFVVRRSRFEGPYMAGIDIEMNSDVYPAAANIDIQSDEFRGCQTGFRLSTTVSSVGSSGPAAQALVHIGSSLFIESEKAAIDMDSHVSETFPEDANFSTVHGIIVGNTIVNGDTDGIRLKATKASEGGPSPQGGSSCNPRIQDNIIYGNAGYGISESPDDPENGVVADPEVVGNDLYGNGVTYLDEGVNELLRVSDVNALEEAWDNFSADPLFVDPEGGDFHLTSSSLCIDAGHLYPVWWPAVDMDGEPRRKGERPNVGADE